MSMTINSFPILGIVLIGAFCVSLCCALVVSLLRAKQIRAFWKILSLAPFQRISCQTSSRWFTDGSSDTPFFISLEHVRVYHADQSPASRDLSYALYIPLVTSQTPETILQRLASHKSFTYRYDMVVARIFGALFSSRSLRRPDHILASAGVITLYTADVFPKEVLHMLPFTPTIVLRYGLSSRDLSHDSLINTVQRCTSLLHHS